LFLLTRLSVFALYRVKVELVEVKGNQIKPERKTTQNKNYGPTLYQNV